jgi:uncharacterized protein YjbJ (UPF0337 family)
LHWPFADPSAFRGSDTELMAQVREVREAMKEKVRQFVADFRVRPVE